MNTPLHHWYHVYADGNWAAPVTDHCNALREYGLYDQLTSFHIGFVGTPENVAAVRSTLDVLTPDYEICATSFNGWEQETLREMYKYVQVADGYISYAHTKGAANYAPINDAWRRSMEYYNFVCWECPVQALDEGKSIVGCHWFTGGPASNPAFGTGGMFGGNYWWTKAELLRQNVPPDESNRHAAEHWLGQLSEVMPITPETIYDMNPTTMISYENLRSSW